MKRRIVLAVVLVGVAVQLWRQSGRTEAPAARDAENAPARTAATPTAPASPPATFSRDPFRFAPETPIAPERRIPLVAPPTPSPDPPAPTLRLVGLVRRGAVLRAALVLDGEVVLASAGETVGGFRLVSLDEEGGVRLRDPTGHETTLALPGEP